MLSCGFAPFSFCNKDRYNSDCALDCGVFFAFVSELTNFDKLSNVELKALSHLLKDLDAGAPRAAIVKGLQKIVDDYVPPEVRAPRTRSCGYVRCR